MGAGSAFPTREDSQLQGDSAVEPMLCQDEFLQPAAEILQCSEPIVFVLEA
jgi:hypothetical protein